VSVDLLNTIRLLHKVLGFLAQQPAEFLVDIAEGRRRLSLGDAEPVPLTDNSPVRSLSDATSMVRPRQTAVGQTTTAKAREVRATRPPRDDVDYAAIATDLRALDNVDRGLAYLEDLRIGGRKPTKADLQQIAAAMGLTVPKSATNQQVVRKLLDHAIGARKKYAGLSKW